MSKKRKLTESEISSYAVNLADGGRLDHRKFKRKDIEKIMALAARIRAKNGAPVGGGCSDPGKTLSSTEDFGISGNLFEFTKDFYTMDTDKVVNDDSMQESLQCFAEIFTRELRYSNNRAAGQTIEVTQVALDKIEALANTQTDHLYKNCAVIVLNGSPCAMVTLGKSQNSHFVDMYVVALPGDFSRHSFPYFSAHTRIGTQDFIETAYAASTIAGHLIAREGIDQQYMPKKSETAAAE